MTSGMVHPRGPTPAPLSTTGIGSLPHTQLELALQVALGADIPYAPSLPGKDPCEFMMAQGLEGLPGLVCEKDGGALLAVGTWEREAAALDSKLEGALEEGKVAPFEPSPSFHAAWRPFLWEVEHRKAAFAKVQCTGPVTARWALRLSDGRAASAVPRLEQQIYRLILSRAMAMARAIRERGARPLLFIDEPSLYLLDRRASAAHAVIFEELRILVLALQKEGALVGLHCCGNADWEPILKLGLDVLSCDTRLSLGALLATGEAFWSFIANGGALALGVVPTNLATSYDLEALLEAELALLRAHAPRPDAVAQVLAQSLVTPACGLGLRSVPDCERVVEDLARAQRILRAALRSLSH